MKKKEKNTPKKVVIFSTVMVLLLSGTCVCTLAQMSQEQKMATETGSVSYPEKQNTIKLAYKEREPETKEYIQMESVPQDTVQAEDIMPQVIPQQMEENIVSQEIIETDVVLAVVDNTVEIPSEPAVEAVAEPIEEETAVVEAEEVLEVVSAEEEIPVEIDYEISEETADFGMEYEYAEESEEYFEESFAEEGEFYDDTLLEEEFIEEEYQEEEFIAEEAYLASEEVGYDEAIDLQEIEETVPVLDITVPEEETEAVPTEESVLPEIEEETEVEETEIVEEPVEGMEEVQEDSDTSDYSLGRSIADYASQWVGVTPYVSYYDREYSSLEEGTDCSGFVNLVYDNFGIYASPASDYYQDGYTQISESELEPGDVVVYRNGGHVAIYNGDDTIIHCANEDLGTIISDMYYNTPTAFCRLY